MASAALGGVDVVHPLPVDQEIALGDALEPRDHAQERRLAAAGGADEDHELLVVHVEIDALDDLGGAVGLARAAQRQFSH